MNVQRFTQLYLFASAVFCVLLLAALVYGDRRMFEPLMLFAIILIVVLPLRRSRR